jgi:hypothetical protein
LLGNGGYNNNARLFDGPVIGALDADEKPHLMLYHGRKGIEVVEREQSVTPDAGGVTVVTVTDRRTLVLVGRRSGDRQLSLRHDDVDAGEYSTGILKHRLTLEANGLTYRMWINSGYDEKDLQTALDLVREFAAEREAETPVGGPRTPGAAADGGADAGTRPSDQSQTSVPDRGERGGVDDPFEKLERLKRLHEGGALTDAEFEEKKTQLLDEI